MNHTQYSATNEPEQETDPILIHQLPAASTGLESFVVFGKTPPPGFSWTTLATSDPDTLRRLRSQYPQATGWAIHYGPRSGAILLDIDPRKGGDLALARFLGGDDAAAAIDAITDPEQRCKALIDLINAQGDDWCTPMVITGAWGLHIIWAYDGGALHNGALEGADGKELGIDLKTDRGYGVGPGSVHPITGHLYVEVEGRELVTTPRKPMPSALAAMVKEGQKKRSQAEPGAPIPQGERESTLMRIAGAMRRQGCTEDEILEALRKASEQRCIPPLAKADLERMAASVCNYDPADPLIALGTTDMDDAQRFIHVSQHRAAYCTEQESDYAYQGGRWERNKSAWGLFAQHTAQGALAAAMAIPGPLLSELPDNPTDDEKAAAKAKSDAVDHATKLHNRYKLSVMQELARPRLSIKLAQFDADPWLFNLANGTLDLRTGELREHRPGDYLTHQSPVSFQPEAMAPVWAAFIERITGGDAELADYLQRIAGLALTGITVEQFLFLIYGDGQNGKSTFVETLARVLGDYWLKLPASSLMVRRGEGIPNDIARLPGRRMVVANEVAAGKRLDEATIKDLTGDDTITARFMRQEFFEFQPTHKLFMYGNYRPVIRGTDKGIWRRIKPIPFTQTITEAERDLDLKAKLLAELPGILNWMVQGCMRWQRDGLHEPQAVRDAAKEYRDEMDVIGQFLEECTEAGKVKKAKASELFSAYKHWAEANGEYAGSAKVFGGELGKRGFTSLKSDGNKWWKGLGLNAAGKQYQGGLGEPFTFASGE